MRNPLLAPQRIAVAGCWHGDLQWACQAVKYAADQGADVIVHSGDMGYHFRPQFLVRLEQALTVWGLPMMFLDGNHDDHQWLAKQPINRTGMRMLTDHIWHIPRGYRWTWNGVRFLGLGGAHSVDNKARREGGLLWQQEETITDDQAARACTGGKVDVLVCHDRPDGVPLPPQGEPDSVPWLEKIRAQEHRRLLRKVADVVQPRHVWHGHYHVRHTTEVDFGWGPVQVQGLAGNDDLDANLYVVELAELQSTAAAR